MSREKIIRPTALLTATILYVWAVYFCGLAGKNADLVHIVLEQGVDTATAEGIFCREAEAEEPIGCCFWGENSQQMVSCQETGASAKVTVVSLSGNPELMGAECLIWQEGCLIDEGTAQTLFGTALCGGQCLWYDGAVYRVLGTVSALRPTMLTMAKAGDTLSRCVLALPAEKGKTLGEQFSMRWGLRGWVMGFYPFLALTENLLLLFPGILLLTVCALLGKGWRKLSLQGILSGSQWLLLGKTVLALGLAVGTLWLLARRLVIPPDMIPSRWSDFSFWGSWWERQKENCLRILFTPLGSKQLQMLLNMVQSMGTSTVSAILALWAVRRRRNANLVDRG